MQKFLLLFVAFAFFSDAESVVTDEIIAVNSNKLLVSINNRGRSSSTFGSVRALAYNGDENLFYAISDGVDQLTAHPITFYKLQIDRQYVDLVESINFKNKKGNDFVSGDFDPLSIAYYNGNIYVAHGPGNEIQKTGILVFDVAGYIQERIKLEEIEDAYLKGISISQEGNFLYASYLVNATGFSIVKTSLYNYKSIKQYDYITANTDITFVALDEGNMLSVEYTRNEIPYEVSLSLINLPNDSSFDKNQRKMPQMDVTTVEAKLLEIFEGYNYDSAAIMSAGGGSHEEKIELVLMSNEVQQTNAVFYTLRFKCEDCQRNARGPFPAADKLCIEYCDTYFETCGNQNSFYENRNSRGFPNRHLIKGSESMNPRFDSNEKEYSYDNCLGECMLYPRALNHLEAEPPLPFGINLSGDTLWCRTGHLQLATKSVAANGESIYYCAKAGASGGGTCTDSLIFRKTPYAWYSEGLTTGRYLGHCKLVNSDRIADCTGWKINSLNFATALKLLPGTVGIIYLSYNQISDLPVGIFNNLACASCVEALYMDKTSLSSLESGVFSPLKNLKILSLNGNSKITELPSGILQELHQLEDFSMQQGSLTTLNSNLFLNNELMLRVSFAGQPLLKDIPSGFLVNLFFLESVNFRGCSLDNSGIPNDLFNDLYSLMYFDLASNALTSVKSAWFTTGATGFLMSIALNDNDITSIEPGIFDNLANLEMVYLHNNQNLSILPDGVFGKSNDLISYTL